MCIERIGVSQTLGCSDAFGENTAFRELCSRAVRKVVSEGSWFSFCTRADKQQIDILGVKNNKGISLGNMAHDVFPELEYRVGIYKYLLKEFLCYHEAPIVVRDGGSAKGWKNSFNKYLVTSNLNVVAKWLDIPLEEAHRLYGSRLNSVEIGTTSLVPYLKLYTSPKGEHKITKPRNDLDLSTSGMRIVPVFALKEGVDILYNLLSKDSYNVSFCKDSGQVRDINVTFNLDKIKEIYKDSNYVVGATSLWYLGDFETNPSFEKGYIRVFELGSSLYDSPLRSINYARIVKFTQAEPDLTYLNIDLDSVLEEYTMYVKESSVIGKEINDFVDTLDMFEVGTIRKIGEHPLTSRQDLITWAECQATLLSTVFLRSLALFMLGSPQWFKGYTGGPSEIRYCNLEMSNFDLDIG